MKWKAAKRQQSPLPAEAYLPNVPCETYGHPSPPLSPALPSPPTTHHSSHTRCLQRGAPGTCFLNARVTNKACRQRSTAGAEKMSYRMGPPFFVVLGWKMSQYVPLRWNSDLLMRAPLCEFEVEEDVAHAPYWQTICGWKHRRIFGPVPDKDAAVSARRRGKNDGLGAGITVFLINCANISK